MGQSNTKVDGKSIRFLGEGSTYYLGNVKMYSATGREKQIAGVQTLNDKVDVMQHASLRHPNLVETINYDSNFKEVWYTQKGMTFYFEYLDISLYDICQQRGKFNQKFTLTEINRLIVDILSVLSYFEQTKTVASWGISTNSIFYDKQEKKMKIYNHELIFGRFCTYRDVIGNKKTYINPEVQHVISNGILDSDDDYFIITRYGEDYLMKYKNKSDVFQFGLVLLEVGTYFSSYSLYDSKTNTINSQEITRRLQLVGQTYGSLLQNQISNMLNLNPDERPSAYEFLIQIQGNPKTPTKKQYQSTVNPTQVPVLNKSNSKQPQLTQSRVVNVPASLTQKNSGVITNQSAQKTPKQIISRSLSNSMVVKNLNTSQLRPSVLNRSNLIINNSTIRSNNTSQIVRRTVSQSRPLSQVQKQQIVQQTQQNPNELISKVQNLEQRLQSIINRSQNVTRKINQ